jgi:outer membrane receptor protein involved in Fe transport
MNVKAYFVQFVRGFDRLLVLPPVPELVPGGLTFKIDFTTYRAGGGYDGDVQLTDSLRMLYGFEAFHEWIPADDTDSRQGTGRQATFFGPSNLRRLPFACPLDADWDAAAQAPTNLRFVTGCPVTFLFEVSRTTIGGFSSFQLRPTSKMILDAGLRLQAAPEITSTARGYGLTTTLSGAAVYQFLPDWHLKLNYAEGFRPPVFNNTDSNGEAVSIDGSEFLKVETSRSGQVEVNARMLRGVKGIRELDLRADYSYTVLDNYISFIGGRYANTARRGINSGELLAKLYLRGGHRFELGYTMNSIDTEDKGTFGSMPNQWFNMTLVSELVQDRLELATILHIYGAFEDPNRRVEARGLAPDPDTGAITPGIPTQTVGVFPYEMVIDRAPPSADLQLGVVVLLLDGKLRLQATVYNAFNSERFEYDAANDYEPRLDITPNRFEAFRFFTSATYDL